MIDNHLALKVLDHLKMDAGSGIVILVEFMKMSSYLLKTQKDILVSDTDFDL